MTYFVKYIDFYYISCLVANTEILAFSTLMSDNLIAQIVLHSLIYLV